MTIKYFDIQNGLYIFEESNSSWRDCCYWLDALETQQVHLSHSRLSPLFCEQLGIPVQHDIISERMNQNKKSNTKK
jgi:hypothetical protein